MAEEYADVYVKLDDEFAQAMKTQPYEKFYSDDGIHPNQNGAIFIGKLYADAIQCIIDAKWKSKKTGEQHKNE